MKQKAKIFEMPHKEQKIISIERFSAFIAI
jgi:hypothetical protein